MTIEKIKVSEILVSESTYFYNQNSNWDENSDYLSSLKNSFLTLGIVEPIVVQSTDTNQFELIHGFHRVGFAKKYEINELFAQVYPAKVPKETLWQYLYETHYKSLHESSVAKVLFIKRLLASCLDRNLIMEKFLPLLDFEPNERVLKNIEATAELPRDLLFYCDSKKYSFRQCFYLTRFPKDLLLEVFSWRNQLHFSASTFEEVLTHLKDFLRFSNESFEDFKKRSEVQHIFQGSLSAQEKIEQLRKWLRSVRFPILTKTHKELESLKNQLALPNAVQMGWDPSLETSFLEFKIKVRDASELEKTLSKLTETKSQETFNQIFEHL